MNSLHLPMQVLFPSGGWNSDGLLFTKSLQPCKKSSVNAQARPCASTIYPALDSMLLGRRALMLPSCAVNTTFRCFWPSPSGPCEGQCVLLVNLLGWRELKIHFKQSYNPSKCPASTSACRCSTLTDVPLKDMATAMKGLPPVLTVGSQICI